MERPTCRTCPYWDYSQFSLAGDVDDNCPIPESRNDIPRWNKEHDGMITAPCRRNPPGDVDQAMRLGTWKPTADFDWCGEHPDFPGFLKSRKPQ